MLDSSASLHTAASIILASKSNYQNIVEGNSHSLGLTYPEELSTGLTSKRTSHKIAEQGRRNRINTALQELNTLLPSQQGEGKEKGYSGESQEGSSSGGKGGGGGVGNQGTSKAVTVERAIAYIRKLREELEEAKGKLVVAEGKLQEQDGGGQVNGSAKLVNGEVDEEEEDDDRDTGSAGSIRSESSMDVLIVATPERDPELESEQRKSPNGREVIMLD